MRVHQDTSFPFYAVKLCLASIVPDCVSLVYLPEIA